jgi:hypothetical protein
MRILLATVLTCLAAIGEGRCALAGNFSTGAAEQAAQVNTAGAAQLRLDLRASEGKFSVEWYRAEDGQSQSGAEVTAGDWRELTAPWSGADVIVRLLQE